MSKYSLMEINERYVDVLREIGNIGAGNATTAIASMLSIRVDMNVPKVELLEVSKLGACICPEDEIIVGIFLELQLDIEGSMMFLMRMDSAHYLVNKLMMRDESYKEEFDEMDLSALKEIGNIIAGSYLSALSGLTNLAISPSIPYLAVDMAASLLSVPAIEFGQYGDQALLIETEFGDDVMINGYFILMPDQGSYDKILKGLEKNIENLNNNLTKNNILELSEIIGNWKKLIWRNFISGIAKGVGIGIGFSIVTAIIIIILQRIITLNIPVISQYIADIIEIVQLNK